VCRFARRRTDGVAADAGPSSRLIESLEKPLIGR
jgi:hypothetical protein